MDDDGLELVEAFIPFTNHAYPHNGVLYQSQHIRNPQLLFTMM